MLAHHNAQQHFPVGSDRPTPPPIPTAGNWPGACFCCRLSRSGAPGNRSTLNLAFSPTANLPATSQIVPIYHLPEHGRFGANRVGALTGMPARATDQLDGLHRLRRHVRLDAAPAITFMNGVMVWDTADRHSANHRRHVACDHRGRGFRPRLDDGRPMGQRREHFRPNRPDQRRSSSTRCGAIIRAVHRSCFATARFISPPTRFHHRARAALHPHRRRYDRAGRPMNS